ncbi:putative protein isoform X1 [Capsicum chacoense]
MNWKKTEYQQFLISLSAPKVDQVQLNLAKQATKSAILMNLEYRMVASEDIGRQLLTYGERLINYFSPVMQKIENAPVDGESPMQIFGIFSY